MRKRKKPEEPVDMSIRGRRRRKGMTLEDLSKLTGIAIADLSRLERGIIPIYPGWQQRIDEALG